jgi:hypothetical protein
MTLITVTIPTYRRDEYLRAALESVLAQTVTDLEVIVSDNANSASTRTLVESYDDPRVAYAPLAENIGLHGNLTRCLHLGSAPYVAVLLDDDTMSPTNLEVKLTLLEEHPTAGVAHSAFNYIDHAGRITAAHVDWTGQSNPATFETGREFIERTMALGTRICASSALLRRAAVAELRHHEEDGPATDLALSLRIASSWDYTFVDEPLTAVRFHNESASGASGLYDADEGAPSMSTVGTTTTVRAAKLRFIDEYASGARHRLALRHLVRDRARTELKGIVADQTLASKRPSLTARKLFGAARVEPSLWWSPWSAVLLASSVFGRRLFDYTVDRRMK